MRTGRRRAAASAVAMALALAACGADDGSSEEQTGSRPEAQPAPGVTSFTEGGFDELPIPPQADPVGPRSEKDGVVARSFDVRNTEVDEVVQFYEGQLSGWDQLGVEDVGSAVRADFERGGRGLRMTAQPAPTLSGDDPRLQLTLQLGPRDAVFDA